MLLLGEGSITTVYSNPMFEGKGDSKRFAPPDHMVPAIIKHQIPNAKIIVMLRDPVAR